MVYIIKNKDVGLLAQSSAKIRESKDF